FLFSSPLPPLFPVLVAATALSARARCCARRHLLHYLIWFLFSPPPPPLVMKASPSCLPFSPRCLSLLHALPLSRRVALASSPSLRASPFAAASLSSLTLRSVICYFDLGN
ncbi:hypothetical protein PIB30_108687, partial [Stylosanthes scabra]|nr:hypothetical protein [Stylosanthes scabra]